MCAAMLTHLALHSHQDVVLNLPVGFRQFEDGVVGVSRVR